MKKWEYCELKYAGSETIKQLNKLGEEGWEVCASITNSGGEIGTGTLFLKREKK